MTTTQRTNRQLAELIVGTMTSMRRMQALYAAATEVERVCDPGGPLADMLVKGFILAVTVDGREQLDDTWNYVLRNVPSEHVAALGIDRTEWQAANDAADDTAAWWKGYNTFADANGGSHAVERSSELREAARTAGDVAVRAHRNDRARRAQVSPAPRLGLTKWTHPDENDF